jgi:hypothetical protein
MHPYFIGRRKLSNGGQKRASVSTSDHIDDVQINISSYAVVKVDMVHDNSKDLKLEMPLDDTTLTMRDAVTRRVQWRQTSIDIGPSAAASTSTTPGQPKTSPASMSHEARLSPI